MIYVVGHRGAAGVEPENTLRGFRYAIELGVDFVECDVHLTRDGHLVVIHDETVDRTTNGTGKVSEMSLHEIRELDAGKGERIPTIGEVLDLVKDRVKLLLELKGEGVERKAVEAVVSRGMEEQVVFTSFHVERLRRVKEINPNLKVGVIFGQPPSPEEMCRIALNVGGCGVGINHRHLTQEYVEEAHRNGLEVRAWNPDTEKEMYAAIEKGVDGVSSNRPDILLNLIRRITSDTLRSPPRASS
jgi:glycerophosphoryl diester phosphodiesterase